MDQALTLLHAWLEHAECDWYDAGPGVGCYGTGYGHWGVQTNQKYLAAAMACAALHPELAPAQRQHWQERALAAFRFMLATHRTGTRPCLDGQPWGTDWISVLGLERMAFALPWLEPLLTPGERSAWQRLVAAEAGWLLDGYRRGAKPGVQGGLWAHQGGNDGESNVWNGCFLWRAAQLLPQHADAARWREQACHFLVSGVSIPADAEDARLLDGKAVRERHHGANFFPSYAFDHHGYLNVGYMMICTSNAALLHFDAQRAGWPVPESLHWHQDGLWAVLRGLTCDDGRLARIGGDSRVRYAYCQDYALPGYLYAAAHLADGRALAQADALVGLMAREAADNGDGSFFGRRLAALRSESPYFVTRLEADRAMVLAHYAHIRPSLQAPAATPAPAAWHCPEHGAAMVRSSRRFASVSWRAKGLGQILCLPPGDSSLADWRENLAGCVRFAGEDESHSLALGRTDQVDSVRRSLREAWVRPLPGGWIAGAAMNEGDGAQMSENWAGKGWAVTRMAAVALPDDATVCVLRLTRATALRGQLRHVAGLRLHIPNDVFNGRRRVLAWDGGRDELAWPPAEDGSRPLGRWANIDGALGAVGLYGADGLVCSRARERRGGAYRSLAVEELDWGRADGVRPVAPGATILDAGWLAVCSDAAGTAACATEHTACRRDAGQDGMRVVRLRGRDGRAWIFAANLGDAAATWQGRDYAPGAAELHPDR